MILQFFLLFIPLSILLERSHAAPNWIFLTSIAAILPLAEWIRRATEQLAHRTGSAVGSLLNVTFGNLAELILALFVLRTGHVEVVKATILGSILGNCLLGLGIAILAGSAGRERQSFSRERAGLMGSLLMLSTIALLVPAVFDRVERASVGVPSASALDLRLSLAVSVLLLLAYFAKLIYTLVTHREFLGSHEDARPESPWPLWRSLAVLVVATAAVALEAELVSGSLESAAGALGLSTIFLGVIVLPLMGNASEYFSAVYFARRDRMDLVMGLTAGSGIQVALLTAPLLVLLSYPMGHPMDLVFHDPLELFAFVGAAFAVNSIAQDGETNWFEGVLLLAVYLLFGMAFYFLR